MSEQPQQPIGFNVPHVQGNEFAYISEAIERRHLSGDGIFSGRCHSFLEEYVGCAQAFLTTSCTDALEMCALLLDLSPGDEVIVPSFTFVSTANAFAIHGAHPVFADIDPLTFNIDPDSVRALITPRTRAIVVVNYAGVGCEMSALRELCDDHDLVLIEDNAHGLGGRHHDRPLGSFGDLATQSFHETKNVQCGEGGALLVNHPGYIHRAEILREKGTNRSAFFRGAVDKYTWVDVGSSFLMSDLQAAFLWAQLEALDPINRRRMAVWEHYDSELKEWAPKISATLPHIPAEAAHPAHMFYVVLASYEDREAFREHMRRARIDTPFHYVPLDTSPAGVKLGRTAGCPITADVSARLVRLPLHPSLSESAQARVIDVAIDFASARTSTAGR